MTLWIGKDGSKRDVYSLRKNGATYFDYEKCLILRDFRFEFDRWALRKATEEEFRQHYSTN